MSQPKLASRRRANPPGSYRGLPRRPSWVLGRGGPPLHRHSRGLRAGPWLLAGILGVLACRPVAAQRAPIIVVERQPEVALALGRRSLARRLGVSPHRLMPDPIAWAEYERRGVSTALVVELRQLEASLMEARRHAAALQEGAALTVLARAEQQARAIAELPGSAAWMAEVQLQLGVVAAQARLPLLAQAALRRAATLDPTRRLRAADAPPEVVELGERIRRQTATAARGELEVRVQVPSARVFLDDVEQGIAPITLRTAVGLHLLRVEAPGHQPYGGMLQVYEGRRPPIEVALAEDPARAAARLLLEAARGRDYAGVRRWLRRLEALGSRMVEVWTFEGGKNPQRELLIRCGVERCGQPQRLERGRPLPEESPRDDAAEAPMDAPALAAARAWSNRRGAAGDATTGDSIWSSRWTLWSAVLVAAATVVSVYALAHEPDPGESSLRVSVDSSGLGQ